MEDITSDFMYLRLHGDTELYRSGYSDEALEYWYKRIKQWSKDAQPSDAKLTSSQPYTAQGERDIYCYFDNTDKLWAPYDARKILAKCGLLDSLTREPGLLPEAYRSRQK